jgi:hypothetical protein
MLKILYGWVNIEYLIRTYDINRIAAGLAWPDGTPKEYSN